MRRKAIVCALLLGLGGCREEGAAASPPGPRDGEARPDASESSDDAGTMTRDGAPGAPDATTDAAMASPDRPWFEDRTEAAGLAFERVPARQYRTVADRMSGGVCVLDVDGRRPLDLFFAVRPWEEGGSRLFVAREPLRYADETEARGLSDVGDAVGCLAFDADGDRDDDLLVTGIGSVRLFENLGGRFVDASDQLGFTPQPRGMYTSAAAGDLDDDRDLDLAIAGNLLVEDSASCGETRCSPSIREMPALPNVLLERRADGRYVDVTDELAPPLTLQEPTLVVLISDLDGDGEEDIYVGNDLGDRYRDRALVREDGVYTDRSSELGLAFNRALLGSCTMGVTRGDLDDNGVLDLVRTSYEGDPTAVFLCSEGVVCEDRSREVGTDPLADTFRWGAAMTDLDLDGWPELFEATGHLISKEEAGRYHARMPGPQPPNLLVNEGEGVMGAVVPDPEAALATPHQGRGIAVADVDEDGRPDILLATTRGTPVLLHNTRPPEGHWLRILLRGQAPNTGGVGARVEVRTETRTLIRERRAGEGYLGNFDPRLLFGVPEGGPVDVVARWPDGTVSRRNGVATDQEIVLEPR